MPVLVPGHYAGGTGDSEWCVCSFDSLLCLLASGSLHTHGAPLQPSVRLCVKPAATMWLLQLSEARASLSPHLLRAGLW